MKLSDITFKDIKNYVEGNVLHLVDGVFDNLPLHIKEQAVLRSKLCQPCTDEGKCTECGCKTPAMYYAPNKVCSKAKWIKMLEKEDWDNFKTTMNELNGDTQSPQQVSDEDASAGQTND